MSTKKEAGLLAQPEPRPMETTNSIDAAPETVNALRELRLAKEIPAQDMVDVVRRRYPRYDKHLQSKAERSYLYGVRLCSDAMADLKRAFAPELIPKENRRKPCRLVCRVSVLDYNLLMERMRADGFTTAQDCLHSLIKQYLKKEGKHNDSQA